MKENKRQIKKIVESFIGKNNKKRDKWITAEEAMKMLRLTSKVTLERYRDEGRIKYAEADKKVIFYDKNSINDLLGKH